MAKRILLVHRYFWPDIPTYAQMLRLIGRRLVDEGHDVTVFCGPPSYNDVYEGPARRGVEHLDGLVVRRVRLPSDRKSHPAVRSVSLLVFAARLVLHVLRRRADYDLVTVTTIPPVAMGVAARIIRRLTGIPYLYHCMDLYPEVAVVSGMARNRLLVRIARRLDATTCRKAAAVVVLSADMRTTLARRGLDASNVIVLNNFEVLDGADAAAASTLPRDGSKFRILFAGNMGRFQGLENLVAAAARLASELPDAQFVFMGSGSRAGPLRDQARDLLGRSVVFVDHQPVAVAARVMEECHVGVVALRPRIHEVAYPSKTVMYLTSGLRIVAVVEEDSDLAGLVRGEEVGVVCPPEDVDALTAVIRCEVDRGPASDASRERVKAVGESYFGKTRKLVDWARLID